MPLIFLALLCLPRYLIADTAHPARFYAPSNLTDLAWSMARRIAHMHRIAPCHPFCACTEARAPSSLAPQRVPSGGAYRVYYAPNTTAVMVQVAEMAAKELLCGATPSVMRTVALGSSFYVDAGGIAASGLMATCAQNPLACAGYLRRRPGGLPPTAALVSGDLRVLCAPACLASRVCFAPVLAEFLTGFPSEAAAVEAAAAVAAPDESHGGGVAALFVLPDNLATSDDVTYTLRSNASDVPNARAMGARWAREKFDPWVVAPSSEWKAGWFSANLQRALDAAIIALKTQPTAFDAALLRLGGVADVTLATSVKQMPFGRYDTNLGASFSALFFGIVFVFAFLTTVVLILKSLVRVVQQCAAFSRTAVHRHGHDTPRLLPPLLLPHRFR